MNSKKFKITTLKGDDVFGYALDENNVYIQAYPKHLHGKKISELEIGESCRVEYSLSGSKAEYYVERVE
jgi:hypothetical protein